MKSVIPYTVYHSPIGSITLASTEKGLCRVEFGQGDSVQLSLMRWTKRWLLSEELSYQPDHFMGMEQQLDEYFKEGQKGF